MRERDQAESDSPNASVDFAGSALAHALMHRLGDLMARAEAIEKGLEGHGKEQLARAEVLTSLERDLLEREVRLAADMERCDALLAESKAIMRRAQLMVGVADDLRRLLLKGGDLLQRIGEATREAERVAEAHEQVRHLSDPAAVGEGDAERADEEIATGLRTTADLVTQGKSAALRRAAEMASASRRRQAARRALTTRSPDDSDGAPGSEGGRLEVRFTDPLLLPSTRLQLKRSLIGIPGAYQVEDAPDGRDLRLRCRDGQAESVIEAVLKAAADLVTEVEVSVIPSEEEEVEEFDDKDSVEEPAGILTVIDLRHSGTHRWLTSTNSEGPGAEVGDE